MQAMLATERLPDTNLEEPDWSTVRNVMVQNLPARLTQSELVSAVEELGFLGQMCYFHLPQKSHGQSRNHGYAFIGFLTPEVAGRFRDAMTGYSFKTRPSLKRVIVRPARIQSQVEVWREDLEEEQIDRSPQVRKPWTKMPPVRKNLPPLRIWKWEFRERPGHLQCHRPY
ncbi:hypothetical protein AK812_SmicGene2114 [Symbiodinium microadriaticum]|uniref:RRM domain-containing protein n=1 Tax=Symbiodinium microadriaticum TaxID=2951 RepID=A0A1Q9F2J4_SYMMI|nr:hypothetical protein AK812_SmicGene2114 [Symbiodinium microadriaticum]